MELLDRYLNAVQFWLPKAQRQDIIQELSDDIRSQIEERESEAGRPLDADGIEAILRRFGHPMVVAARFLPERCLVGPTLFPLYTFVLKVLALVYFVPWLFVWVFFVAFVPAYRAEHPGLELPATLRGFWFLSVHTFAFVTLGFAVIERKYLKSHLLASWNVRKLPLPRDPNRISRGAAITSLISVIVFILWWVGAITLPAPPSVRMAAGVERLFYWPVLLLALAVVPSAIVDVGHPWWTRRRALVALVIDGGWAVVLCLLLAARQLVEISPGDLPPERVAEAARWINLPVLFTVFLCAVSYVLRTVQDVRRLVGRPPANNRVMTFLTGE